MFLTDDISTQVGTMALVPQVVDAVRVPVIVVPDPAPGTGRGCCGRFRTGHGRSSVTLVTPHPRTCQHANTVGSTIEGLKKVLSPKKGNKSLTRSALTI
jgi:hypothetical protein